MSRRGASSTSTTVSPFLPLTVTGTISSGSRPSSVALIASSCERTDQRSMSARVSSSSAATSDASCAMCLPLNGFVSPSLIIESIALRVAHAEAEARALQQVGRVRHRLHAAADGDLEVARADRRVEDPGRADARRAHLVDRLRRHLLGDPRLDLRLARGDLPLAGLDHLAHDDVLDLLGLDAGALERGLDRGAAELGRVERGEAAAELADRGARGTEDDGLGHRVSVFAVWERRAGRRLEC